MWFKTWWTNRKIKKIRIRGMLQGMNTTPKPGNINLCQVYQFPCYAYYWVQEEIDEAMNLCNQCAGWKVEEGLRIQVIGEATGTCKECADES